MKKLNIKLFTALFVLAIIAGVCIFNACKKEETIKNTNPTEWAEKIEYMEIPCVDFSRIKKETRTRNGTMLVFESWEHYANVIDALLDFSYDYFNTRVQQILAENPGIDEDELSLIVHNEGVYQFMPLYSFCQQLQFNNSAFQNLRAQEIQWMQNPNSAPNNPFDESGLGYVESALHAPGGGVIIGEMIYKGDYPDEEPGPNCRKKDDIELRAINNNKWPTYYYNDKIRQIRGFLSSNRQRSYAKTSVYYYDNNENLIVWCANIGVTMAGVRLAECAIDADFACSIYQKGKVFASVCEKYDWHIGEGKNSYLHPLYSISNNEINFAIVHSWHTAHGQPKDYILGL